MQICWERAWLAANKRARAEALNQVQTSHTSELIHMKISVARWGRDGAGGGMGG